MNNSNEFLILKARELPQVKSGDVWPLFGRILVECVTFFQMNFVDGHGKFIVPNVYNPVFIWKCVVFVRKIMDLITEYKKKNETKPINK